MILVSDMQTLTDKHIPLMKFKLFFGCSVNVSTSCPSLVVTAFVSSVSN